MVLLKMLYHTLAPGSAVSTNAPSLPPPPPSPLGPLLMLAPLSPPSAAAAITTPCVADQARQLHLLQIFIGNYFLHNGHTRVLHEAQAGRRRSFVATSAAPISCSILPSHMTRTALRLTANT